MIYIEPREDYKLQRKSLELKEEKIPSHNFCMQIFLS
jgi:hypothetical protein